MATTTIISSVTAGGSYPTDVSISASNGCGSLCFIPTADITEQMTYELPAISVDVIMPDDSVYTNIQIVLDNIQGDEPYIIPLYELPSSCSLRVMPLFDKYALTSHNETIECGFEGTIWDTPTATFPISVVFDDTDISSEGGSGGGGGQSGATVLSGSSNPSSSIGSDGDMYLKTTNTVIESVTFTKPQRIQLDYYMNKDSVVELDCILPSPTDSYDTPLGSRGNTDHFVAYNGGTLRYVYDGDSGNIGSISSYYNKRMLITISRTNIKVVCEGSTVYDTAINGGTTTSDVKLGLFALFTSNSGSTSSGTSASGTLYRCRISENSVVVRDYIPRKDAFGNYCLYDTISGVIYPPLGGSITGTEVQGDAVVDSGFVKVNSEWQPLIGTELDDINTHGGGGPEPSPEPSYFPEDCPFRCNVQYLQTLQTQYSIAGRFYAKTNSEYAIGLGVRVTASGSVYTSQLFLSSVSPDAVAYSTGATFPAKGSIEFEGVTWYYSDTEYAQGGSYDVSGLHMYPDALALPYSEDDLLAVFSYVHATNITS